MTTQKISLTPQQSQRNLFMIKYYPKPIFIKILFLKSQKNTQTSDNQDDKHDDPKTSHPIEDQVQQQKSQSICPSQNQLNKQKQIASVKPKFGNHYFMSNYSKINTQKERKSMHDSQIQYKQLLQELKFNEQTHKKNQFNSQKFQSEHEQYYQYKYEQKKSYSQNQEHQQYFEQLYFQNNQNYCQQKQIKINQQINKNKNKASTSSQSRYKFDPLSQLILRKKLKLQKLSYILNKSIQIHYKLIMKILKHIYTYNYTYCKSCRNLFRNLRGNKKYCNICVKN